MTTSKRMHVADFKHLLTHDPEQLVAMSQAGSDQLPLDFVEAKLQGTAWPAGLRMLHARFDGADFTGAVFTGEVSFMHSSFRGARLRSVSADSALFQYCNAAKADFSAAYLPAVAFYGTTLVRATFDNCTLAATSMQDCVFDGASLRGALVGSLTHILDCQGIYDAGLDSRGYRFVGVRTAHGVYIKAGCRWLTYPAALKHWEPNKDARARVALLKTAYDIDRAARPMVRAA